MKVALISRSSLFTVPGGDTTQVVKTAEGLTKLGVRADVFLAADKIDYEGYDLLHFFNITRPADHLLHIRRSRKPYLVSTIYLDYTSFDRNGRNLLYRLLFRALGKHRSELFKNLYRYARRQDRMVSPEYLAGHKLAMKKILAGASLILPNSESEYRRIVADTGYQGEYAVIPNGIDLDTFSQAPPSIQREEKVLCVAQVYGMKNQHLLIQACRKLNVPLEIIGKAPPNHSHYYDYCRKIGGEKVRFFDFMPQTELITHYAGAKVHALPSWFETTGLTSLEAGVMGCNLVVGEGGDTHDYFKEFAWYCDAGNQESVERALEKALSQQNDTRLKDFILTEYTWHKASEKTREAYKKVLDEE
jgi:glycosyltransferase involved in cell wall biosynthesis